MNVEITENHTQEIIKAEQKAVLKALTEIGLIVEGDAADKAPVDTGRLKNSMTHRVEENEKAVYVGTNVEYAPYVEYGHRIGTSNAYVAPKPFLKPAVEENRNEINSIIKENLTNA